MNIRLSSSSSASLFPDEEDGNGGHPMWIWFAYLHGAFAVLGVGGMAYFASMESHVNVNDDDDDDELKEWIYKNMNSNHQQQHDNSNNNKR